MKDITKHYSNDDITIVWQPLKCTHSTFCWKGATGLINVFDPSRRPWITPEGGTTEEIIERIERCPSGALSYVRKDV
ncbi:MAG: (4Fe-4S)-binding protein [Cytophaga sp.]|uniref:(4Fe-4S)-binding protein n=1 Tax=Cytophaga sp. TaxID=29535 RepID=UPI003F7EB2D1